MIIATAHVRVRSDLTGFNRDLLRGVRASIKNANKDAKVKVEADTTGFEPAVEKVRRRPRQPVAVPIAPDTSRFAPEVQAFLARFSPEEQVKLVANLDRASFNRATAEARRIAGLRSVPLRVEVDQGSIRTVHNLTGALGNLASLGTSTGSSLIGLAGNFAQVGGAAGLAAAGVALLASSFSILAAAAFGAAGALATIPNFLGALGQGFGVGALAASGLSDAVGALGAAQLDAGRASGVGAKSQVSSAKAIRAAQEGVADAERTLARARQQAADAASDASRQVRDAERSLIDVQKDARDAQADLTRARRDARSALIDLRLEEQGLVLDEEEATLRLEEAHAELNRTLGDPEATALERARADLRVRQAEQGIKEVERRLKLNKEEIASGVEGSDRVVAAKERVQDAEGRVTEAVQAVADAQRASARTARDSGQAIADAQRGVERALLAQRDAAASAAAGTGAVSAAQSKLKETMDALSPAGQRFAKFLFGLRDEFRQLRDLAQEGILPGLQTQIGRLVDNYFPLLKQTVKDTSGVFAEFIEKSGDLINSGPFRADVGELFRSNTELLRKGGDIVLALTRGFTGLSVAAIPLTQHIADLATEFSTNFADAIDRARKSGGLAEFFNKARAAIDSVVAIAKNLGGILFDLMDAAQPAGQLLLDLLAGLTEQLHAFTSSTDGQQRLKSFFDQSAKVIGALLKGMIAFLPTLLDLLTILVTFAVGGIKAIEGILDLIGTAFAGAMQQVRILGDFGLRIVQNVVGALAKIPGPLQDNFKAAEISIGIARSASQEFFESGIREARSWGDGNVTQFGRAKGAAGGYRNALRDAKVQLQALKDETLSAFDADTSLQRAKLRLQDAQAEVTRLQKEGKTGTREYKDAVLNLRDAQSDVIRQKDSYKRTQDTVSVATLHAKGATKGQVQALIDLHVKLGKKPPKELVEYLDFLSGKVRGLPSKNFTVTANGVVKLPKGTVALPGGGATISTSFWRNVNAGGPIERDAGGGVPGHGSTDTVPAMLTPGEFVIRKSAVRAIGLGALHRMNQADHRPQGLYLGGIVMDQKATGEPPFTHRLRELWATIAKGTITGGQSIIADLQKKIAAKVAADAAKAASGAVSGISAPSSANRTIVREVFANMFGWGNSTQLNATDQLLMHESGYRNTAQNPTSTAYGLFQFLNSTWGGTGIAKTSDPRLQAIAGGRYIRSRYSSPAGAWNFWQRHHWYGGGGPISERIEGIGTRSGKHYTFGERGPYTEDVVPRGQKQDQGQGQGGIHINVTLNGAGVARGDVEDAMAASVGELRRLLVTGGRR